ncbi:hypothetical protein ACM66B_001619 [Microbotryomycetes sp. NB124-2]
MGLLARIKSRSQGDLKQPRPTNGGSTDPSAPALPRKPPSTNNGRTQQTDHRQSQLPTEGRDRTRRSTSSVVTAAARDEHNTRRQSHQQQHQEFSSRAVPTRTMYAQANAPQTSGKRDDQTLSAHDSRSTTTSSNFGRHSPFLTSSPQLSLHSHSDEHEQEVMSDEWRSVLVGAKPNPHDKPRRASSMLGDGQARDERRTSHSSLPGTDTSDFVARPPRRSSLLAKDFDLAGFAATQTSSSAHSTEPTPTSSAATTPKPALAPLHAVSPSTEPHSAFAVFSPAQTFFGGSPTLSQSSRFTPEIVSPNLSANSLTSSVTHESTTPHTPPVAGHAGFAQYRDNRLDPANSIDQLSSSTRSYSSNESPQTVQTLPRSPKLSLAEVDEARQSLQRLDASFGHSSDSSSSFSRLSPGAPSNGPSPIQNSPSSLQSPLSPSEIAKFHLPSPRHSQSSPERQIHGSDADRSNAQRTPKARSSAQFMATVSPPSPRVQTGFAQNHAATIRPPSINTNVKTSSTGSRSSLVRSTVPVQALRSRFEQAVIIHADQILSRVLVHLDYRDTVTLRTTSKTLKQCLEVDAKELVLQRFLTHFGYRTIRVGSRPPSPDTATTPASPHRAVSLATVSPSASSRSSILHSPAPKVRTVDPVPLNLRDLDVFLMGHATPVEHYAMFARDYAHDRLHPSTLRLARASTRAWNRIVARIRAQQLMHPATLWPPMYSGLIPVPSPDMQIFKHGRAPVFRVWVPTGQGHGAEWMTTEELIECEREVWRSGVWNELRKGDVVANVAISRLGNLGRVIFDGKYLRDFMFKFDHVGHLPNWLNGICFPPAYFHNVVATSTPLPIVYLGLTAFVNQIRSTLTLQESQVPVSSPQGRYLVKTFVYRGTIRVQPGTIVSSGAGLVGASGPGGTEVVHDDWCGTLVVETDGTNEHAALLVARASSNELMPYRIIREKSRPGQLWIRPVMDNEAIA